MDEVGDKLVMDLRTVTERSFGMLGLEPEVGIWRRLCRFKSLLMWPSKT
jgi:hypothetical protein